jgi:phosphoribosylformylglycinamidine cyclo-ligase
MTDTNASGPTNYTYEDAGVSIAAGNALVKAIGPLAKSTRRPARTLIWAALAVSLT